jgi:MGT family glycosyltransferase
VEVQIVKIAWFGIPAYGHTNPSLGIVKEMTDVGHEVYYFSFDIFKEKLENVGAQFISCDGYDFAMEDKENADRVGKDMAFATELLVSSTLALDGMVAEKVDMIKPDIIVADSIAYWGKLIAMKYNTHYVSSTTTFAFNRYSSKYMKRGLGEIFKMLLAMPKISKQISRLKDKGYPIKGILDIVENDNETNTIVYTSKYFQPCADTFSEKYHFIGPSIRPIENRIKKTAEKTIYISMGTVNKSKKLYLNCIEAFEATDYQIIISMGANRGYFEDLSDNIQVYEHVDQMAVLAIADVFITHCGMNSASEGLYFEVPLVLFPQTPEQGAVATRVEELGAGIILKSIEKEEILNVINEVLDNPKYKEKALKISESFKDCGGVKEARIFLETIVD